MIVIPYIVEEPSRRKIFTQEMEKAAILCLSEAKRKKPSVLRGSAEETEYIAKLSYPLWAVPWKGKCIIVDGLGLSSTTILHSQIPSVLYFSEDLKRSSFSFSLFKKILEKHKHTFERFASAEKVVLKAISTESSAFEALSDFVDQAKQQKGTPEADAVMVPTTYDHAQVENITGDFLREWQRLQTDVDGLRFALQVLSEQSDHHKEKVSVELELIRRSYENRISEAMKDVDKNVRRLDKEREKQATKAEKLNEKEIEKLDIDKRKLHQKANELERSLDAVLAQKKVQKRRYPKRSTSRIDSRISLLQKRIKQVNSEIHQISDLQKKSREKSQQEHKLIEEKYLNLVAKEAENLEILEQSRNLEMSEKSEKIREMENLSSRIETQINNLIAQKAKDLETLENMTLQLEAEEPLLIGIPFYVIQYRLREKTRRNLYPPMTAASYEGILKRIQIAILSSSLEARMQLLLAPRSSNLNNAVFANFQKCLSTNSNLKEQIGKIACLANLLTQLGFKDQIVKGLDELEGEGWLNSREKENMIRGVVHD
jgi:chromosome segregation ATPase